MTTISREKLYEKVWSQPLTKVAAGFGVTGTALKKTCARHNIPTLSEATGPSFSMESR